MKEKAQKTNPNLARNFFVVHNLWRYTDNEEVDLHIETDIIKAFNAEEVRHDNGCITFDEGGHTIHLVLAREHSPAGEKWNSCTLKFIKNVIMIQAALLQKIDLLEGMKSTIGAMLPSVFVHPAVADKQLVPHMFSPTHLTINTGGPQSSFLDMTVRRFSQWLWSVATGSEKPESKCQPFSEMTSKDFDLHYFDASDNNTYLGLVSKKQLNYYPSDPETMMPATSFDPRYDIFANDWQWVLFVDVLDSEYDVHYEQNRLTIAGCRSIRGLNLDGMQRINKQGIRKYSTFSMTFELPQHIDGLNHQKQAECTNGVLRIQLENASMKTDSHRAVRRMGKIC
eukprot:c13940_g1_i1.p1 GENE.c13940_g1_i1~~c13940_g1_i1.p1  ORF type:complete len:339 (-),score=53.10 c13940_g1_i1:3-1019(-)